MAYQADSDSLLSGDVNGVSDIFALDRTTGVLRLLSIAAEGVRADRWSSNPTITSDGALVLFQSDATNLVDGDTNETGDVFIARGPSYIFEGGFESGATAQWSKAVSY